MSLFAKLLNDCLQEPKTNRTIAMIEDYMKVEDPVHLPFALHFLLGNHLGRFCSGKLLREWCADLCDLPVWLVDESYEALGDNSETMALCLVHQTGQQPLNLAAICNQMQALKAADVDQKRTWIVEQWQSLLPNELYAFNKLLGGGIRIGASKKNVLKALSAVHGVDALTLEQRLLTDWAPTRDHYDALVDPAASSGNGVGPYPFFLASPLPDDMASTISSIADWCIEPKWDGIRAQLVHRPEGAALWSRGNELITPQFPDVMAMTATLPYGVYDGELLAWANDQPLPFYELQQRLNRKKLSQKLLEQVPCTLLIYDCLEWDGQDRRSELLRDRRAYLESIVPARNLSTKLTFASLEDMTNYVAKARDTNVEGVMIKRLSSTYQHGRVRGDWWKLKVAPLTLDVVIMYAQKGRGVRSGLFTDYTFGVWDSDQLVPIGKAYSGLTNDEIKQVNQLIKANLTDKFGPVRGVSPVVMLEVAFDGIQPSTRHKAGLALRFPRIKRLRLDKPVAEASTLADARALCQ